MSIGEPQKYENGMGKEISYVPMTVGAGEKLVLLHNYQASRMKDLSVGRSYLFANVSILFFHEHLSLYFNLSNFISYRNVILYCSYWSSSYEFNCIWKPFHVSYDDYWNVCYI